MSSSKKSQTLSDEPVTIEESIYTLMCKMAVNEKLVVPIEAWKQTRYYAYDLKDLMDRQYTVHRMHTRQSKMDFLLVTRTK